MYRKIYFRCTLVTAENDHNIYRLSNLPRWIYFCKRLGVLVRVGPGFDAAALQRVLEVLGR
jgi:hypothetical protein